MKRKGEGVSAEATLADERLASDLARISALPLTELRREWQERWGEPPAFRSRELLSRAMAYRLQAERFGGLSRARANQAREFTSRFTADRKFTPVVGPALKVGSTLIREWRGIRYVVAVATDGFVYDGERFSSLSKIAERISGVKRNGPAFFGLREAA